MTSLRRNCRMTPTFAIQKQHEAWYLAKEAEKAAKAARSSSSSKSGSVTTDSDSYAAMAAAADSLKGKEKNYPE